jgi:hypothetical protein
VPIDGGKSAANTSVAPRRGCCCSLSVHTKVTNFGNRSNHQPIHRHTPPPSPITTTPAHSQAIKEGEAAEAWEGPGFHFFRGHSFRGHSTDFWLQSECDTGPGPVGECGRFFFAPERRAARTQNTAATRGMHVSQAVDAMSKLCSIQSSRKSTRHTSTTGHRRVNYCLRQPRILLIFYIPAKDQLSQ